MRFMKNGFVNNPNKKFRCDRKMETLEILAIMQKKIMPGFEAKGLL